MESYQERSCGAELQDPLYTEIKCLFISPLRKQLFKHMAENRENLYSIQQLAHMTGRMVSDVESCLEPMVEFDIVRKVCEPSQDMTLYGFHSPRNTRVRSIIRNMLTDKASRESIFDDVRNKYFEGMIGVDEKMKVVFELITTVAKTDISVLIRGPTGSGKELVSRAIHELSRRNKGEFHAINCAALPETLLEAELFGYEKGSFTGAGTRKVGRLELADKGTLFLDEIGDMPIYSQIKLLRVLETKKFERVGGTEPIESDFRLISATNQDLESLIEQEKFREDLYYRINVFPIRIPSLRERKKDIPILSAEFLRKVLRKNNMAEDSKRLSSDAISALLDYDWPGNIRELENVISRSVVIARGNVIKAEHLHFLKPRQKEEPVQKTFQLCPLSEVEADYIERVLHAKSWNIKESAAILGISRGTLYKKISDYSLEKPSTE